MAMLALSRDDVALPPGTFDIRGWEVRTEPDDESAGRVEDLLVKPGGAPRYLVVALRHGDMGHLLVPLSRAWADPSRKVVWVSALTRDALAAMPRYGGDPSLVTPEMEARLLEEYRRGEPTTPDPPSPDAGLVRLGDLDEYRVAKGSADPRSWTVVGGDGDKMGTVVDLIVDRADLKTRYLDCDVNEDRLELERLDRHVLIPVEHARLDHDERRVVVAGLFGRDMGRYPMHTGLPLVEEAERELAAWYERPADTADRDNDWAERAARRFFGSPSRAARREGARSPAGSEPDEEPRRIPEGGAARVRLPEEGEVRIRVSGDDIVIERDRSGSDG
ncbi:MAG: PRC-barrel domain-containing protein [Gemmatimonadetes bacterium]|nr:PRC-barrel domain-containing protein [Gemmatimonadota bacterium]